MLHHLVTRLRAVPSFGGTMLATTVNATDIHAAFAEGEGVGCFRGSEDDVIPMLV